MLGCSPRPGSVLWAALLSRTEPCPKGRTWYCPCVFRCVASFIASCSDNTPQSSAKGIKLNSYSQFGTNINVRTTAFANGRAQKWKPGRRGESRSRGHSPALAELISIVSARVADQKSKAFGGQLCFCLWHIPSVLVAYPVSPVLGCSERTRPRRATRLGL